MQNHTPAQVNAETALYTQARSSVACLVKLAMAKHLFETERQTPRRWFGFGGEVPILNAKAVMLLAPTRRRAQLRLPAN
jgi:hypothetical protein